MYNLHDTYSIDAVRCCMYMYMSCMVYHVCIHVHVHTPVIKYASITSGMLHVHVYMYFIVTFSDI